MLPLIKLTDEPASPPVRTALKNTQTILDGMNNYFSRSPNSSSCPRGNSNSTVHCVQEREYSRLIDTANAPIFGVDNCGRVNIWNQCATNLVGYTIDEVMGEKLVEEFITKDYQASVQHVLDQALQGKETANFEFPLMTKAGARIDVLLNATTRCDEQGNVVSVISCVQLLWSYCIYWQGLYRSQNIAGSIAQLTFIFYAFF